jgi:iron complex outermembrane receptor protein
MITTHPVWSQHLLRGTITDGTTQQPLEKVTIYIPELNTGTLSDSNGRYSIQQLPWGKFNIQFSYIGFETKVKVFQSLVKIKFLMCRLPQTGIQTGEVVIYGTHQSALLQTPKNIVALSQEEMRDKGSLSLSDAVSKIPGMSQLSTGAGISKPVIRGLYGNRDPNGTARDSIRQTNNGRMSMDSA